MSYADGPGLQQAITNRPNVFTVYLKDKNGNPAPNCSDELRVMVSQPDDHSPMGNVEVRGTCVVISERSVVVIEELGA